MYVRAPRFFYMTEVHEYIIRVYSHDQTFSNESGIHQEMQSRKSIS